MVKVVKVVGPLGDRHLTRLHSLLSQLVPQGAISGMPEGCGRADIPDMMIDGMLGGILPPGMLPGLTSDADRDPGETKVTLTPNGISIQSVRTLHKEIGPRLLGGQGMGIRQHLLEAQGFGNPHMVTGDDFPMHADPLESILSLLYAKAQESHMDKDIVEGVTEEAKEDLGDEVTEKVLAFIEDAKDGNITVRDGDKLINVTISHNDGGEKDALAVSEVSDKIASLEGNYLGLTEMEKKAALIAYDKHMLTNTHLQKVGLTHTDLIALKGTIDTMRAMLDDTGELEALSEAVQKRVTEEGDVTLNNSKEQKALHDALVKVLDEDPENGTVHEMVYNTKIPAVSEAIVHVSGHPVDLTKLHSMTKREATSKYTPSLANYVYDEDKHSITIDKLRSFMKLIASVSEKDPELAELFKARLIVPLFSDLEPDEGLLHEDSIVEED